MVNYDEFLEEHIPKRQFGYFSDSELQGMTEKLPDEIVQFLTSEGICSYSNNFLWTTSPGHFNGVLAQWGLNESTCIPFLRTAFGAFIYYNRRNKKIYLLDPLLGRMMDLAEDLDDLLNMMLMLDTILENGFFINQFKHLSVDVQTLQPDEIVALFPALPLGGSFETSKEEVVKMKEHLILLAQLSGGKARRV
ncbi:GAD-like domain-containing protein [Spirosoma sp.]|uniref:GAD-like domain-containing protein n=1 Tax=Spirosoma sp. TaxID=1899569 RepID=UPI00261963CC|nr:GAD-like domain-containing protein [Spirosoma sp.]MCX6218603.1 GAD-like domain-containing protein [Spirosoma sp.]